MPFFRAMAAIEISFVIIATFRDFGDADLCTVQHASSSPDGGLSRTWVPSMQPATQGNSSKFRNFAAMLRGCSSQRTNSCLRLSIEGVTQCVTFQTVEVEIP